MPPLLSSPTAPAETTQPAAMVGNPFVRAAIEHEEPFHDASTLMTASAIRVGPIDVAAYGYMRNIVLLVTCSGGVGGSPALKEDGPWSILDAVSLEDVNGRPIVGPLSGYDLYLINKWGGYRFGTYDPASYPSYVATAMNPAFKLLVPVELTPRDGVGALPNLTASQTYKLSYTIAASGTAYTTAPSTTLPTVRVRAFLEAWSQPAAADARGVPNETKPPYMGTTQYWTKATYTVNAGENNIQLKRVGNLLRNLILVFRNATPVRNSSNFPSSFRWELDSRILKNTARELWADRMQDRWGQAADTGVFVESYTHDGDGRPGNEVRHLYLPTGGATRLEFAGSFGVAGTLTVLTNDVAPSDGALLGSGQA